jgi:hypothetical protein
LKKLPTLLPILIGGSLLTAMFTVAGLTTQDAIERLLYVGLGSIGAAIITPCWGLLGRRPSIYLTSSFVIIVVLGAMGLNAWACQMSGTNQTHLYDHWFVALFTIPGLVALVARHILQKRIEKETTA